MPVLSFAVSGKKQVILWCNLTHITKETLRWPDELYPKSSLQGEPTMTSSDAIVYMTDVYNLLRGILP